MLKSSTHKKTARLRSENGLLSNRVKRVTRPGELRFLFCHKCAGRQATNKRTNLE